jgi:hypothetical protein
MAKKNAGEMFTDWDTEYDLVVTVADGAEEPEHVTGTLKELAEEWEIVAMLLRKPDGTLFDESMIYEPLYMDLVTSLAHYQLKPLEE